MTTETYTVDAISGKATINKDPAAELDYTFDWTAYLSPMLEIIVGTPVITIKNNNAVNTATLTHQSNTTTIVTAWIAGGTIGDTLSVNCKIVTQGGRTDDRTIYIKIKAR